MIKEAQQAILRTIAYSDVFAYPLTKKELWHFLLDKKTSRKEFEKALKTVSLVITEKDGFYCFLGREDIIAKRKQREKVSYEKIKIAKRTLPFFSWIPTVRLIGISGALAMNNADKNDDIDLFVVVRKNSLWTTRLFILLILQCLGLRRKRKEKNPSDKICLNMLFDERALGLPKEKQDLFGAHEVVQMMPIFERGDAYGRFIRANLWVKKFLPNSLDIKRLSYKDIKRSKNHNFLITQLLNSFEFLAKVLQLWYMRKHRTIEIISDHMLAFHPLDHRQKILKEYNKRLRQYQI
ncbi:MAG: hypothetical protein HYU49_00140 [Candidatus Levybacteria bacterium]|nr:hypothetical protein [Candidatus Levybacteria bacterium]MBI2189935.1 hypothetical protein [Candidatus Levybacteria bacterium]MBI3092908.1 hypothetical protein [Candidatus Levybacteria bacterium]